MMTEEGFFDGVTKKVDDFFMPDEYQMESDTGYKRRVLDRRIEGYLDAHFDEYITTYQIVTSLDLEKIDEQYERIEVRVKDLKTFALDTDAQVSNLEMRVDTLKRKVK